MHDQSDLPVTFCASQFLVHPFPEPLKDVMWRPYVGIRPDSKRLAIRYAGDAERRQLADRMHKVQPFQDQDSLNEVNRPPVQHGGPAAPAAAGPDEEEDVQVPGAPGDEDGDAWGISSDEEEDPNAAASAGVAAAAPRHILFFFQKCCVLC